MKRPFLYNEPPSKQLLFTGLVIVACWIAFQVFGMITGILIFGIPVNELLTNLRNFSDPEIISFLKYVQAITSFGMFVFASFIIAREIDINWLAILKLDKRTGTLPGLLAGVLVVIILPFTNLLSYLNNEIPFPEALSGLENFFNSKEDQMEQIMKAFLNVSGSGALFINLLVIAVIPALGEELVFRGIVQDRFTLWFKNHHYAIIITAIIFSALHIQFLSFLPRFFLGTVLGYLFYWSKSIWLPVIAHFINNALAVVFYHYYYSGKMNKTVELIGTPQNGLIYSFITIIAGGVIIFFIIRYYRQKRIITS